MSGFRCPICGELIWESAASSDQPQGLVTTAMENALTEHLGLRHPTDEFTLETPDGPKVYRFQRWPDEGLVFGVADPEHEDLNG